MTWFTLEFLIRLISCPSKVSYQSRFTIWYITTDLFPPYPPVGPLVRPVPFSIIFPLFTFFLRSLSGKSKLARHGWDIHSYNILGLDCTIHQWDLLIIVRVLLGSPFKKIVKMILLAKLPLLNVPIIDLVFLFRSILYEAHWTLSTSWRSFHTLLVSSSTGMQECLSLRVFFLHRVITEDAHANVYGIRHWLMPNV